MLKRISFAISLLLLFNASPVSAQQFTLPYQNDFETAITGWTFPPGLTWYWGVPQNPNFQALTGSKCIITNLNCTYGVIDHREIVSPMFNLTGTTNPNLSFWFRSSTDSDAGFYIDYTSDGGLTWTHLGNIGNPRGINWYNDSTTGNTNIQGWSAFNNWTHASYELTQFVNTDSLQFRFSFESFGSSASYQYGVQFDNFMVADYEPVDAALIGRVSDRSTYPANIAIPHQLIVKNTGGYPIDSLYLHYSILGGASGVQPWNGSLAPGVTDTIILNSLSLPVGIRQVTFTLQNDQDYNALNDTFVDSIPVLPVSIPAYSNNFESSSSDYYPDLNPYNTWQWGTPAYGVTTGAHSGSKCWDVNLNTALSFTAGRSNLYSPFFNTTNRDSLRLGFWLNYNMLANSGMHIEYSLDSSKTWNVLGILNDPLGIHWYDSISYFPGNFPYWTLNSFGWKYSRYDISSFPGSNFIQFRFTFDPMGNPGDGVSVDDFFFTAAPEDATVLSIVKPEEGRAANFHSPVIVKVKNSGRKDLTSATFHYSLNGGSAQAFSWTGLIHPEDSSEITIGSLQVPSGNYTLCTWINISGDVNQFDDTVCVNLSSRDYLPIPYSTNFDSPTPEWELPVYPQPDYGWTRNMPYAAFSPVAHSGNYSLINQNYDPGQRSFAYSPYFNFSGVQHPAIRFWQYYALNKSKLRIEYMIPDSVDWKVLGSVNDTQNWNPYNYYGNPDCWNGNSKWWQVIDLNAEELANVQCARIRIVLQADSIIANFSFGALIDDFEIFDRKQSDAEVVDLPGFSRSQVNFIPTPPVNVLVRNAGIQPITAFTVNYSYDDTGAVVSQSWNGSLNPFDTVSVQLPPFTPAYGLKVLKVWVTTAGDIHTLNDTLDKIIFGDDGFLTIPYYDPCEENNGSRWQLSNTGTGNQNSWSIGNPTWGVTTGVHDGRACWDVNPGSRCESNGERCYFMNRLPFLTDTVSKPLCLTFWQNRNIRNVDEFFVECSQDATSWRRLSTFSRLSNETWEDTWNGNSNGWRQEYISLRDFYGVGPLYLRFGLYANIGGSAFDGVSVDDIRIDYNSQLDAAVVEMKPDTINFWPGDSVQSVTMLIRNLGLETITNFTYGYNVDGYQMKQFSWSGTLEPLDTIRFTLPGYVSPNDSATMKGFVTLFGDGARENDTLNRTLPLFPLIDTSFTDTYDGRKLWTLLNYGAWGFFQASYFQAPPWSPPQTLNIFNSFNYNSSFIYSPVFDFDRMHYSYLRFRMWYFTEEGISIQYTTDKGSTWTDLGSKNDPLGTNWFNSDSLGAGLMHGWTGVDSTWKQPNYLIGSLGLIGRIQFRFSYLKLNSTISQQVQVDDFQLIDSSLKNIQLLTIDTPVTGFIDGVPAPLVIHAANNAATPSGGFQVRTTIDNGSPRIETVNGTVLPNDTTTFALQPLAIPLGTHTICATIVLSADVDTTDNDQCITVQSMPLYLAPFSDDFDGVTQGWTTSNTGNLSTQWEEGTPAGSAYSLPNAWDVNLSSNYFDGAHCNLTSPWIDMTTGADWLLSFYSNYAINSALQDGARLRYQFYEDSLSSVLGILSDPAGINWYSANLVQGPAWQGSSGGWIEHFFRLNSNSGFHPTVHVMPLPAFLADRYVRFTFEFESDNDGLTDAGYSMDNFNITSTVGVRPVKQISSFNVFPVPTNGQFIIQPLGKQEGKFSAMLMDLTGHVIKVNNSGGEVLLWDVTELSSGIYFLRITCNDGTVVTRKIVKN